jgi:hypothetical protein
LARWWNHFSQLLNVHGVIDVRQTEICTEEPIVSEFRALEFEIAIHKLNRHKSPDIDQIPAEFIKVGVEQFAKSSVNLLILFGITTNCLRKRSLYLFIRRVIKQTSNYSGISGLSTMYKTLCNILLSRLTPYAGEITGDRQCGF